MLDLFRYVSKCIDEFDLTSKLGLNFKMSGMEYSLITS